MQIDAGQIVQAAETDGKYYAVLHCQGAEGTLHLVRLLATAPDNGPQYVPLDNNAFAAPGQCPALTCADIWETRALPAAGLLANLSNTAWFGDSLAQPQHLQIARLRALETGRPMLRATNTGMTALIDAQGQIQAQLPPFTRGVLQVEVRPHRGATPYSRSGNWGALALMLLAVVLSRSKSSRSGATLH